MNKILLAAAAAVVMLGAPALAKDTMTNPMDATLMCRPATKTEKPDAMMGSKGLVCKSMAGMPMPNTKGMDKAASDKAWQDWLDHAMLIPAALGTGAGG